MSEKMNFFAPFIFSSLSPTDSFDEREINPAKCERERALFFGRFFSRK